MPAGASNARSSELAAVTSGPPSASRIAEGDRFAVHGGGPQGPSKEEGEREPRGQGQKTFVESAAALAIDAAQAPIMAPHRLGRAVLGVEGPDASQEDPQTHALTRLGSPAASLPSNVMREPAVACCHSVA
jgi:hypothetical protein